MIIKVKNWVYGRSHITFIVNLNKLLLNTVNLLYLLWKYSINKLNNKANYCKTVLLIYLS